MMIWYIFRYQESNIFFTIPKDLVADIKKHAQDIHKVLKLDTPKLSRHNFIYVDSSIFKSLLESFDGTVEYVYTP